MSRARIHSLWWVQGGSWSRQGFVQARFEVQMPTTVLKIQELEARIGSDGLESESQRIGMLEYYIPTAWLVLQQSLPIPAPLEHYWHIT